MQRYDVVLKRIISYCTKSVLQFFLEGRCSPDCSYQRKRQIYSLNQASDQVRTEYALEATGI